MKDLICESCPNNEAGTCSSQDKVMRYDKEVLKACRIPEGEVMPYADFIAQVRKNIIDAGRRSSICGDCSWDHLCGESEQVFLKEERIIQAYLTIFFIRKDAPDKPAESEPEGEARRMLRDCFG